MHNFPGVFQKRMMWSAVTALSMALLGALLVGVVYIGTRVLAFLQPLLVPFAVAGVLAYLLEPVVLRLMKWGLSRHKAVWVVFSAATVMAKRLKAMPTQPFPKTPGTWILKKPRTMATR